MALSRNTAVSMSARSEAAFASGWHAAWAVAVALGAAALALKGQLRPAPEGLALAAMAAPGVFGAALARAGGPTRVVSLALWAVGAVLASVVTGGLDGPLAAWSLTPAIAGLVFRERSAMSLGAALGVAAAAMSALATALAPLPHVDPAIAQGLSLLVLTTIAVGVSAAAIGARVSVDVAARPSADGSVLAAVLAHQPFLFAVVEQSGRILRAVGAPIGRYGPDLLPGRSLGHLVAESDLPALAAALHTAARNGRAVVDVLPVDSLDGRLEIALRDLGDGRFVAAIRDAHEQFARERRLESERITAEQQNAGKSRFLANMSHELRTPLNAIMGFSDIMRQRLFGPLGDRYAEYAELIHESGTHLLELINDVLDMSKIEAERFELAIETFDARDAVSAVLRLMRGQADRAGVNLRGVLPITALYADADRRATKQIALNLISNALKFTPRGGSVTVTVQGVGDVLELSVSDTGVGIAPPDLERLGRPFEQAGDAEQRAKGSGLGLSLVRAFARLHGGEMIVESVVGEGTTVTVRMPVLTEAHQPILRQV